MRHQIKPFIFKQIIWFLVANRGCPNHFSGNKLNVPINLIGEN
jgi:hypothetical protein